MIPEGYTRVVSFPPSLVEKLKEGEFSIAKLAEWGNIWPGTETDSWSRMSLQERIKFIRQTLKVRPSEPEGT